MGDICVDPDGARRAGAAISANTADARARVKTQFDEAAPAAQANEGWKTGPARVDFAYMVICGAFLGLMAEPARNSRRASWKSRYRSTRQSPGSIGILCEASVPGCFSSTSRK